MIRRIFFSTYQEKGFTVCKDCPFLINPIKLSLSINYYDVSLHCALSYNIFWFNSDKFAIEATPHSDNCRLISLTYQTEETDDAGVYSNSPSESRVGQDQPKSYMENYRGDIEEIEVPKT